MIRIGGPALDGPFDEVECERCGCVVARARSRRLFWILVCLDCERELAAEGTLEGDDESLGTAVRSALRGAAAPALSLLVIGLLARAGGERLASFVAGALAAEVLTWGIFALVRTPLEGPAFAASFLARLFALVLAQGPELPWLADAARLDLGTVGFFLVLLARAAWFGCWWLELVDEPDDDDREFERGLSIGRGGSPVAPPSRRR
ncbi:MAG: hypothetical protein ACF8XB_13695 [Planctomycetota bacterium JB042]